MDSNPATVDVAGVRGYESIAAEHRALGEALGTLEGARDPGEVLSRLDDLRGLLEEHFAGEEADDGLPGLVGTSAAYLLASMQTILDEHQLFLADLAELADQARACVEAGAELRHGIAGFAERLRDHERRETSLVTDAVNTDLGRGD
jgi:Hemerythrin HHE cation binding domain